MMDPWMIRARASNCDLMVSSFPRFREMLFVSESPPF